MALDPHLQAMREAMGSPLRERSAPRLEAVAEVTWELLDNALPGMPSAVAWECRPRCSFCCHAPVGVFVPEALAIATYLREGLEPAECQAVLEGLRRVENGLRDVPWHELLSRRARCLFLTDEGLCGIYPVRPLACRSLCSISARACEVALTSPDQVSGIPYDHPALTVAGLVVAALAFALQDHSLPLRRLELHSAVAFALSQPQAAEQTLSGNDVFSGCVPDGAFDGRQLAQFMQQFDRPLIIAP